MVNESPSRWFKSMAVALFGLSCVTGLGAKTVFTNSLEMDFLEVTEGVWLCIHETRCVDYEHFVEAGGHPLPKPGFEQEPDHPVVNASWEDAQRFSAWLTSVERELGLISEECYYRLPTEEEWMTAAGVDLTETRTIFEDRRLIFEWGDAWPPPPDAGNFSALLGVDAFEETAPVMSFPQNRNGFFDLSGNVWEWCHDVFEGAADMRVLKGGSWRMHEPTRLALNRRIGNPAGLRLPTYGFRLALVRQAVPESAP